LKINFEEEVAKRKTALLEDLFTLLRIPSERDDSAATSDAPFGPFPKQALLKFLELAKRDDFATTNVDNYAGHFEYGAGSEVLGIFVHMDVVPAGNGWDSNPYEPVIKNGKLFARGAADDKGPAMAAYYALKILKELNVPFSKKARFVIGTDEETGWGDMEYYFKHVDVPEPDVGFAPDAAFPIINGEKGNVTEYLHFAGGNDGKYILADFHGGLRENMVPESSQATITTSEDLNKLNAEFAEYLNKNNLKGSFEREHQKATIKVIGKSAHGATPKLGINSATYLAQFLKNYEFNKNAVYFLKVAGEFLLDDHDGKKIGVAIHDQKMGDLSVNPGVFNFSKDSSANVIALNFRYPKGHDPEAIQKLLKNTLSYLVKDITISKTFHAPHYVPLTDPLVATLLQTYEDHTGEKGSEKIIGGGTFGRLLKRGVAFGAMFPDTVDTMHQANEYIVVDELLKACAIYTDALYRLLVSTEKM